VIGGCADRVQGILLHSVDPAEALDPARGASEQAGIPERDAELARVELEQRVIRCRPACGIRDATLQAQPLPCGGIGAWTIGSLIGGVRDGAATIMLPSPVRSDAAPRPPDPTSRLHAVGTEPFDSSVAAGRYESRGGCRALD
jgi:hypothetical protein